MKHIGCLLSATLLFLQLQSKINAVDGVPDCEDDVLNSVAPEKFKDLPRDNADSKDDEDSRRIKFEGDEEPYSGEWPKNESLKTTETEQTRYSGSGNSGETGYSKKETVLDVWRELSPVRS